MIKKIIIDTNALMAVSEFNLDIFTEIERIADFKYELYVFDGIIIELEKIIEEQKGKFKSAAKLALKLIEAKNLKIIETEKSKDITKYVDDILVEYSKNGYMVLTQDANLKKRLKAPYMTIRQKKKVIIVS